MSMPKFWKSGISLVFSNANKFLLLIGILQMAAAQAPMETMNTTRFPAEWEPHELTFMQWPESLDAWEDASNVRKVQWEIAALAKAIADYEKVVVLVSPNKAEFAKQQLEHRNIQIEQIPVDDLWARDTMPAFRFQGKELQGVSLNFNGWGDKEGHVNDGKAAEKVMAKYDIPQVKTWLVGEGGALENDGEGTLLVTESSMVNENRNPGKSRNEIEAELKKILGVEKVIWFDGVAGEDITDAHVDCIVRFVRPGVVLLNRPYKGAPPDSWSKSSDQAYEVLKKEKDARGKPFEIIEIFEPDPKNYEVLGEDFVASYVNFYIANGAVIMPKFGDDDADQKAQKILADNFPGRKIVPVAIPIIASGGGGIHCSTHELPSSEASPAFSSTGLLLTGAMFGIFNGGL